MKKVCIVVTLIWLGWMVMVTVMRVGAGLPVFGERLATIFVGGGVWVLLFWFAYGIKTLVSMAIRKTKGIKQ